MKMKTVLAYLAGLATVPAAKMIAGHFLGEDEESSEDEEESSSESAAG